MSQFYLYKITTPNQKIYIGITDNPQERWNHHCSPSSKYKSAISSAIQKYGKKKVKFEILQTFNSEEEALKAEAKIVDEDFVKSKNTYNLCLGGGKPPNQKGNAKAIKIDGVIYPSIHSATLSLGCTRNQLERKIKLNLIDYQWVEQVQNPEETKGKAVRTNLVRSPRKIYFNNETFSSYREACQKYNLNKDQLLKCRRKLGRDHVTLEEVLNFRIGKKPIEINGVLYDSRVEAKQKTGLSMYKILEIAQGASSQNLKKKQVAMICPQTNQVLQVFESMTQAAKFVQAVSPSKICMCCKSQRRKAYGYHWSYIDQDSLEVATQDEH